MPRTARSSAGGVCYHVINRGNARAVVFHEDADYEAFVALLDQPCRRLPMRLVGCCVMPNHFHLVLWPFGSKVWVWRAATRLGLESSLRSRGRPRRQRGHSAFSGDTGPER